MSQTPTREAGRRGRPGYDREAVLEIAVAAFNERGYDGTGMEELAKRLGITKSAIYHHVSGKEELLELAVNRAMDALDAVLEEPLPDDVGATARLEYTVRRSVAVLAAELPYVRLLLRLHGNSDVERRALGRRRAFDRRVTALVAAAAEEGGIRADIDPGLAAKLLFGTVNSLIEWYRPDGDLPAGTVAEALTSIVFDGMRAGTAR